MEDCQKKLEELKKETLYYKGQVDKLAAENLKNDYNLSSLQLELKKRKKAFELLSLLQKNIIDGRDIDITFQETIYHINATLGMDKTIVLTPTEKEGMYTPSHWVGYKKEFGKKLIDQTYPFPLEFSQGNGTFVVNKQTEIPEPIQPLVAKLKKELDLPFFVCVAIPSANQSIGIIVSGHMREAKPLYPPFNEADIDTFQSIASFISSSLKGAHIVALEESNRLQNNFFANISHEFRTPITLSLGPLRQILAGKFGNIRQDILKQLNMVERNQSRLLNLVNQILDIAKFESGKMELQSALIPNINAFLSGKAEFFKSILHEKGVSLKILLDEQIPENSIYLDVEKFDKVIFNLFSNASKFTKEGSVTLTTKLLDNNIQIKIEDSGSGISQAQLPYVFDRFRQADEGRSRQYMGSGIGLSLVKEVVELHKGTITAQSQLDVGTSFLIQLPIGKEHLTQDNIIDYRPEENENLAKFDVITEEGKEEETTDIHNQRVIEELKNGKELIVYNEDNADFRKYLVDLLSPHYNVLLATNGKEGLDITQKYQPDLVLTDSMMPILSGEQFITQLREYEQKENLLHIPVIMLTAKNSSLDQIHGLEKGANDYINKPFNDHELIARIRNLIHLKKQEKELAQLNIQLTNTLSKLSVEQKNSESLLLNILPNPIAKRLKEKENPIVDTRQNVTVLFADIVNFTKLTRELDSIKLITILNEIFTRFDEATYRHGIEKIKTIGDAYMAVGGLVIPQNQSENVMQLAIEMLQELKKVNKAYSMSLKLRIGIHFGSAIAGVIGSKKFIYDLWGDTVNTASRMESNGLSDAIQVSEQLYNQLQKKYNFQERKNVLVKGIGNVNTYVLKYKAI